MRSQFPVQPLAQLAGGDVLAVAAGKGRVVDREDHLQRGLVDGQARQRPRMVRVADRVADFHLLQADDRHDVAGRRLVDLQPPQVFKDVEGHDLGRRRLVVRLQQGDGLALPQRARLDAADGDAADVLGPVQRGDQHLQRRVRLDIRAGDFPQHQIQQRTHRIAPMRGRLRRVAFAGRGEDEGEFLQVVAAFEFHQQIEGLVQHLKRPRVGPIDFVHQDDRFQAALQGLGQHEPGLGHDAFGGVDQDQRAVGHAQHAFHLAAEIRVSGRVDDVDLDALIRQRDVLGQDRDPAFPLQVVAVQDAIAHELAVAELAALPQQAVDQRGLAVIDVGDDDDVPKVFAAHEYGVTYFWFEPFREARLFRKSRASGAAAPASYFLAFGNRGPPYWAAAPNSSSIRSSWLYLAIRSLREAEPVLIWQVAKATARSAIVASSVSPLRWLVMLL